jgi:hypothetical protein
MTLTTIYLPLSASVVDISLGFVERYAPSYYGAYDVQLRFSPHIYWMNKIE